MVHTRKNRSFNDKLWRDAKGRVVIWQTPNWLLISWLVVSVVWLSGRAGAYSRLLFGLGTVLLVIWAVLELTRGVNLFRRILGGAVLAAILISSPLLVMVLFRQP